MKYFSIFLLFLLPYSFTQTTTIKTKLNPKTMTSSHPIILVHGFAGWGKGELLGYRYWGGSALDVEAYLRNKKFNVHTASLGPISSNHDRTCDLFYQIKGGTVDYGKEHCRQFGHKRHGKTYKGFYPQWSSKNPIHLIGHSMGGQTSRLLAELLAQDYFGVGSDETWVKSITTISTPHNGTTLATMIDNLAGGFAEQFIGFFLALAGTDWMLYDFDLDHWGLIPKKGESLHDFLTRIDKLMKTNKADFAMYDLLPVGANKLNKQIRTFSNIYYFSYATEETYVLYHNPGHEWGEPMMNPLFWVFAHYMGHYEGKQVVMHKRWWKNDGVVNTCSMKGPQSSTIVDYSGTPQPGVWNYMGLTTSKDHCKVIGHYQGPISGWWLEKYYLKIATFVYQLPE